MLILQPDPVVDRPQRNLYILSFISLMICLHLSGCLPEPSLTYQELPQDFGTSVPPVVVRDSPTSTPDLGVEDDMKLTDDLGLDMLPPLPPRLRTLQIDWVGTPQQTFNAATPRVSGSFQWTSAKEE